LHPDAATPTLIDDDTVFDHSPNYASGVSTASPIQYFCQKNLAVLLTDGRPQNDQAIGSNTGLRDYDGDCPNGNDGVTCDNYDMKVGQGYESAGSDYLVFTASDATGNSQPITTQIQVGKHPNGTSPWCDGVFRHR
jgi:hypothetical protein